MRKLALILFLFCIVKCNVVAQEQSKKINIREKGIILGYGEGIDSANVPEGIYKPLFFIAHLGLDFHGKKEKQPNKKGIFTIYLEPQVNPVFIKKAERKVKEIEFGVNIGLKHMFPITPRLYTYVSIGVGPHFTSVHTRKQKRGFLFSDNLGTGLYYFFQQNWAINFTFRLRHLSNGDTMKPNMGINTFNYYFGISKVLR